MRGCNLIYHHPYTPPIYDWDKKPYICRLAPNKNSFEFEWFDLVCSGDHTLTYWKKDANDKIRIPLNDFVVNINGLEENCEYEFYIESEKGVRSNTRIIRTCQVPEGATVINYLHPKDKQYDFSGNFLCSPGIVRTNSGRLIASMDIYGEPQLLTLLFFSDDNGKSWRYLNDLYPFYWGTLFYYKEVLYIIGLTTEYGNFIISNSLDEGKTWSAPVTIFYGSNSQCKYGGFHRAPMPITIHNDRLYTSAEYGCWDMKSFIPCILSIHKDDDLMVPENWVRSEFLQFDGDWKKASNAGQGDTIEGNIVRFPDGNLYSCMRWKEGSYLKLKLNESDFEKAPDFCGIINAPVTDSMFKIIPYKDKYLFVTNHKTPAMDQYENCSHRNRLSIFETTDIEHFKLIKDVVNFENEDPKKFGFQYPCIILEGDELLMAVRSSFNNADTFHDTNYCLFFREKLPSSL